ncbi:aminoglycoside phosphotransferase [Lentzea sp. CA-135723]|uniref:aminoglycoside phosphotransferase n=1 Tax=Lentzea sp. CA-135723 TaxID=3239950 RepID=UPI003D8E5051
MSSQLDWQSDDSHGRWLRRELDRAAAKADAELDGEPVWGWRQRSVGARVRTPNGPSWLRVVSEDQRWAHGDFWTGNVDAASISGVAKPRVLDHWEWTDGSSRLRAELMTLAPGRPCSVTPEIRQTFELPDGWWQQLRESLAAIQKQPERTRVHLTQDTITRRAAVFFGDRVDPTITNWAPAHTDLHWANLLAPECVLVDWEGWGIAPAGFDAATLHVYSLLQPGMAAKVEAELGDQLSTRDSLLSQLYVTGRLLLRIESGDFPDLVLPLHHNADRVIERLSLNR